MGGMLQEDAKGLGSNRQDLSSEACQRCPASTAPASGCLSLASSTHTMLRRPVAGNTSHGKPLHRLNDGSPHCLEVQGTSSLLSN